MSNFGLDERRKKNKKKKTKTTSIDFRQNVGGYETNDEGCMIEQAGVKQAIVMIVAKIKNFSIV